MKRLDRKKVAAYFEYLQKELKLTHWDIRFVPKPCKEKGIYARFSTSEEQVAEVQLCAEFLTFPVEYQREIIVHEFCHLVVIELQRCCLVAEQVLTPQAAKFFEANLIEAEERIVQHFTRLLAPKLKVPRLVQARR